jgi:hypothetical protein
MLCDGCDMELVFADGARLPTHKVGARWVGGGGGMCGGRLSTLPPQGQTPPQSPAPAMRLSLQAKPCKRGTHKKFLPRRRSCWALLRPSSRGHWRPTPRAWSSRCACTLGAPTQGCYPQPVRLQLTLQGLNAVLPHTAGAAHPTHMLFMGPMPFQHPATPPPGPCSHPFIPHTSLHRHTHMRVPHPMRTRPCARTGGRVGRRLGGGPAADLPGAQLRAARCYGRTRVQGAAPKVPCPILSTSSRHNVPTLLHWCGRFNCTQPHSNSSRALCHTVQQVCLA